MVRRCVFSRNLVNEEALAHRRLLRQKQTNEFSSDSWRPCGCTVVNKMIKIWYLNYTLDVFQAAEEYISTEQNNKYILKNVIFKLRFALFL